MRAARGATQAAPGGSAHGMGGGCVNFLGHNVVIPSAGPSSAPALFPHVPHRESVVGMKTAWSRRGWGGRTVQILPGLAGKGEGDHADTVGVSVGGLCDLSPSLLGAGRGARCHITGSSLETQVRRACLPRCLGSESAFPPHPRGSGTARLGRLWAHRTSCLFPLEGELGCGVGSIG